MIIQKVMQRLLAGATRSPSWGEQNFQQVIPDETTSTTSIPTACLPYRTHTICCAAIRHRMSRRPIVDEPADR